ncbi:MAG: 2-oxoacid:acceptor oxidoreductase family protein [Candidatus Omnitrophica bacterium]|nr:2-oxoacid:acceptor oxidoreductase family protein [Candidatus Omnitrophota bacterium]
MTEEIIIAGAGGQGVMLLGKVLAQAGLIQGKYVTWLPSYGAEVRGGTAYCMVIVSDKQIGSPYIDKADTLIIMNEPSFRKFYSYLKDNGLLILNTSFINLAESQLYKRRRVVKHPFTDIAMQMGNARVANMIALGGYLAQKDIVDQRSVIKAMEEMTLTDKRELLEVNKQALYTGLKLYGKS